MNILIGIFNLFWMTFQIVLRFCLLVSLALLVVGSFFSLLVWFA